MNEEETRKFVITKHLDFLGANRSDLGVEDVCLAGLVQDVFGYAYYANGGFPLVTQVREWYAVGDYSKDEVRLVRMPALTPKQANKGRKRGTEDWYAAPREVRSSVFFYLDGPLKDEVIAKAKALNKQPEGYQANV